MASAVSLPGYVFGDKLGSGSYATVYKAFSKTSKREVVAIKCVEKSSLNKPATENLLTEISILKKMKHEHIVEMKDFLWDNKHIYIIMELCSGGDLSTFVKTRRTLPEKVVKRFLQQLAIALQYLRSHNIAHMDLKPQNILLSSRQNPTLKLADFGFAQYLKPQDDATSMRGSPLYMAPEILLNRKYDARVDLWSVGVILYECLFGKAPYSSQSFSELAKKIMNPKPIQIPYGVDISDECRDLLTRLLQREPDERISFEEFFTHPFIDLEHMPSKMSYEMAVRLVSDAVEQDSKGNYPEAVMLYCQALQHFVPAIQYERDLGRKEALRQKLQEYLSRAEMLKERLKPNQSNALSNGGSSKGKLAKLASSTPHMLAALKVAEAAEELNTAEIYEQALEKYELALGVLIPLLSVEPKGERKDLLNMEVQRWMKTAENIKEYLSVAEFPLKETGCEDGSKDVSDSIRQQCCVQ